MKKAIITLIISVLLLPLHAQFDAFKYVVVPVQFEAFPQANQHKTSTLIKFYLEQYGYPAVYDLGKSETLEASPCLGVYTQFNDDSNLFSTKVSLTFVDCEGKIVFETQEGRSKEKDYQKAYKEAIEQAFLSFNGKGYTYRPPAAAQDAMVVTQTEASANIPPPPPPAVGTATVASARQSPEEVWYAQAIENGFQLVDSSPKIRMKLLKSSRENTYIAVVDGQADGTVYLNGDTWIHEFARDGEIRQTPLNIKF